MPIYEYQCRSCGNQFEILQKMNDEPLVDCGECGAADLQKLISAVAFRLKGTGWYETDFKNGSQAKRESDTSNETAKESDATTKQNGSENKDSAKASKDDNSPTSSKSDNNTASNKN